MKSFSDCVCATVRVVARIAMTLFGLVFLLGGMAFVVDGGQALVEGLDSNAWPRVRATVVENHLTRTRRSNGRYTPHVTYRYAVGPNTYNCTRLWIVARDAPAAEARALLAPFVPGQKIDVHVNPEMPSASVVTPGADAVVYFWIVLASCIAAVGIVIMRAAWSRNLIPLGFEPGATSPRAHHP
jgi:Protein of unknown function (DUF3592)